MSFIYANKRDSLDNADDEWLGANRFFGKSRRRSSQAPEVCLLVSRERNKFFILDIFHLEAEMIIWQFPCALVLFIY